MEEKKPMLPIWQRMEICRRWSQALAGPTAKDDLESWLLQYRRRLAVNPHNLLRDLAVDLRLLPKRGRGPLPADAQQH